MSGSWTYLKRKAPASKSFRLLLARAGQNDKNDKNFHI